MLLFGSVLNISAAKLSADLDKSTHGGSNGSYDQSTHVYTWTGSTDSRVVLYGLSGDLSGYDNLVINFTMGSDYSSGATIRIDIITNSGTTTTTYTGSNSNGGAFYSSGGEKTVSLTTLVGEENVAALKDVNAVRINTNSASGSATINYAYLSNDETFSLEFDANGECDVPLTMLDATTATYYSTSGVVTSTGSGSLSLILPSEGVDMSKVSKVVMSYDGTDLVNKVSMTNGTNTKSWYSSKYTQTFTGDDDVTTVVASPITAYTWTLNTTSGTMTISSLKIYSESVVTASFPYTYNTFASSKALDFTEVSDVKAYVAKADVENSKVTLTRAYKVAANTGLILVKTGDATTAEIPVLSGEADTYENDLVGVTAATDITSVDNMYVLQEQEFRPVGTSTTTVSMPANKAYLVASSDDATTSAKTLNIVFGDDDSTTGITDLTVADNAATTSQAIYTITGQRVSKDCLVKGQVYIQGGKKYIAK